MSEAKCFTKCLTYLKLIVTYTPINPKVFCETNINPYSVHYSSKRSTKLIHLDAKKKRWLELNEPSPSF